MLSSSPSDDLCPLFIMNYQQCMEYLNRLGNEVLAMRFGLDTIRTLLKALGNPQQQFPALLIAGTNGKGSVARFLSAITTASGIHTGLFTSPHLVRLEERICRNQRPVEPDTLARILSRVIETAQKNHLAPPPTYFETLTAAAMCCFQEAGVELAILEVGMGGRLDSTNVVDPLLSIITPVGLDHQQFLGNTLCAIAREKCGILRPASPVILSPQKDEPLTVILETASQLGSPVTRIKERNISIVDSRQGRYRFRYQGIETRLSARGKFQTENAAVAIEAARLLDNSGFSIPDSAIRKGLGTARTPGCVQKIPGLPSLIVDGGHNPDAARQLVRFVEEHTCPPRALVAGMMRDKDIGGIFRILQPLFQTVYLAEIRSSRAATVAELQTFCPRGIPSENPMEAIDKALQQARTVVVAGSFYLAGEILKHLGARESLAG